MSNSRLFQKDCTVNEDAYHRSLNSVFEIAVSCTDVEWTLNEQVVFVALFLPIHTSLSSFNENIANVKMQDVYYLETILKGTGSVIVIANDQLWNTTSSLLSFILEIVNVAVR